MFDRDDNTGPIPCPPDPDDEDTSDADTEVVNLNEVLWDDPQIDNVFPFRWKAEDYVRAFRSGRFGL